MPQNPFPPAKLTGHISKAARRELGMSQAAVIEAAKVPQWVLKFCEGRLMKLDSAKAKALCDFYESQGVNLHQVAEYVEAGAEPPTRLKASLPEGFTSEPRPGFFISEYITPGVLDVAMAHMEANDDRIADLMSATFERGFLGGISDESETKARELFATLAENYVLFRFLQGRNIIGPTRDEPKTIGDYLAHAMRESPALPIMAKAKADAEPAEAGAE